MCILDVLFAQAQKKTRYGSKIDKHLKQQQNNGFACSVSS